MNSRREFLKQAALMTGAVGLSQVISLPIQKALAISAAPGSTVFDAEHVVILMQENRSFDHVFGKLQGVRGFNDPRAYTLPDQNKVWLQKDAAGNTYAPFHIDINKTKITWQGGLPHSWNDQVAARNQGQYDKWVPVKSSMSLGFYDRSDIPFYYALADAFTVCDHNFCSSLTGTTPNRLYLWTGGIRAQQDSKSVPVVNNSQAESRADAYVDWETFPELLEDHGIAWKVYQNELWTPELKGAGVDNWLGNFGDNPLEYVKRHHVRLSAWFRKNGDAKQKLTAAEVQQKYDKLSQREKNLIDKAFDTNINAPFNYLELAPFEFTDDQGARQRLNVPRHDIFHQFRSDVDNGKLPAVSWLVAPEQFSDHASVPFYGMWYVSEAIDILVKNPEVWKKTVFILTYDENDGYFDHIPPFVPPKPGDPLSGKVSEGIDQSVDYELRKDSPIGLGYRVPMLIASPWSKGGYVNSQVCDHTSVIMFLECLFSKKIGRNIRSKQISSWRRTVCGDLTSAFRPADKEDFAFPERLKVEAVITGIQNAKNKPAQVKPAPLPPGEIDKINAHHSFEKEASLLMPQQERGTRPACALPYYLSAECQLDAAQASLILRLTTGPKSVGAPFSVYSLVPFRKQTGKTWSYAVKADNSLADEFDVRDFEHGEYRLCVSGPNGFFRKFQGSGADPRLHTRCVDEQDELKAPTGNVELCFENEGEELLEVLLTDEVYRNIEPMRIRLAAKQKHVVKVALKNSSGWYDFRFTVAGKETYHRQYAGHVENATDSQTDPYMGGAL